MSIYESSVTSKQDLFKHSIQYATEQKINDVLVFTNDGDAAIALKKLVPNNANISIIATTFPANETRFKRDENDELVSFVPSLASDEVFQTFSQKGIQVVRGTLPFENMVVPGATNIVENTIQRSLSLISPGLYLAVESILMATDQGILTPGKSVLSIVGDIAIEANATNAKLLFHPTLGLQIKHVVARLNK
jgi:hypothetical protein